MQPFGWQGGEYRDAPATAGGPQQGNNPLKASGGRICVISLGINGPVPEGHPMPRVQAFARGIRRIREDLAKQSFPGDFLSWEQIYPPGSPMFSQIPFAFKPFCFEEARSRGYELALWLDSSIKIKRPLTFIFELIRHEGYLICMGTHSVGEFCKDEALLPLGIDREESFTIPSCSASIIGLNFLDKRSLEFLREWRELACDGITFPGAKWSGVQGWPRTASLDRRVKGHRHDQTAASVIAWKLGMNRWQPRVFLQDFFENDRRYVKPGM